MTVFEAGTGFLEGVKAELAYEGWEALARKMVQGAACGRGSHTHIHLNHFAVLPETNTN